MTFKNNKEKTAEYQKKYWKIYYKNNRDKIDEYHKKYWKIYYKKNKSRLDTNTSKRYYECLFKCLEYFGNKCKNCGITDKRVLQLDHVHGKRKKDSKLSNVNKLYIEISEGKYENEYQLLCANCNWIKRTTNKEWCSKR